MFIGIEMHSAYVELLEFTKDLLNVIEDELRAPDCKEDLFYIYNKIGKSIRVIDCLANHVVNETDHFPFLNESLRCQDIIHKFHNNYSLSELNKPFFSRLVSALTRLCHSLCNLQKRVYENGLAREFI